MPTPPPGGWTPPPGPPQPAKKSNVGLIVGIVVGVILLACVGGGVAVFVFVRNAVNNVGDALSSVTAPVFPTDTPIDDPTDPDPGPSGETFDMAIGDGVRVQDGGDEWHVWLVDAQWFSEPCEEFGVADHPILVLDIEFEVVTGTASLNTLFDFSYIDDTGASASPSFLSFCDEPSLTDTLDRRAGDLRTGKIAFEVPGGKGGKLEYVSDFEPTASWVIPGQV